MTTVKDETRTAAMSGAGEANSAGAAPEADNLTGLAAGARH